MKRKITFLLASLTLLFILTAAVSANGDYPLLIDESSLLSEEEQFSLTQTLTEYSDRYDMDIVIVTVDSLNGNGATESADYVFDNYGYGRGDRLTGVLLLVSMGDRELAISTSGLCINYYDDPCINQMISVVGSYLTSARYYDAFVSFVSLCVQYADQYETYAAQGEYGYDYYDFSTGGGYGDSVTMTRSTPYGQFAFFSLFIGFFFGLIKVGRMKKMLNSVKSSGEARAYVRKNSLNLTAQKDVFLYRNVTRTPRNTENRKSGGGSHHGGSVHISSGGHAHGGGSGHF